MELFKRLQVETNHELNSRKLNYSQQVITQQHKKVIYLIVLRKSSTIPDSQHIYLLAKFLPAYSGNK